MTDATYPQKNIVILGAGFGGLAAARTLGKALLRDRILRNAYDIILIDRRDAQTYTPGLYEVATALREDAAPLILKRTAAIPLEDSLRRLPIRFIQDEIVGVDIENGRAALRDGGTVGAEYFILALGATTNDFGIQGVREHGLMLKTFEDALRIRSAAERTLREKPEARVLIAGGGATGVELTGELVSLAKNIRRRFHGNIRPRFTPHQSPPGTGAGFTIIDAAPRLIPGPPDRVARMAQRRLERLGVSIRLNAKLVAVQDRSATITLPDHTGERIPFDFFVWSGGIKPIPLLEDILLPKDARGRCLVDANLTVKGNDRVFAIGDLTCFADPASGQSLPATASIAIAEGRLAAENILGRIRGQKLRAFRPPKRPPFIVPISGKWAVAHVFGLTFAGSQAFFLRLAADFRYFLKILPLRKAVAFFLSSTMVYFRND